MYDRRTDRRAVGGGARGDERGERIDVRVENVRISGLLFEERAQRISGRSVDAGVGIENVLPTPAAGGDDLLRVPGYDRELIRHRFDRGTDPLDQRGMIAGVLQIGLRAGSERHGRPQIRHLARKEEAAIPETLRIDLRIDIVNLRL